MRPGASKVQLLLHLDAALPETLQGQLFEQLRDLIRRGQLRAGDPLPSSRALSKQLQVSRNTVSLVYDRLVAEGYLNAIAAQGTYVADSPHDLDLSPLGSQAVRHVRGCAEALAPYGEEEGHRTRLAVDFRPGAIDPALFPVKSWRRLLAERATEAPGHLVTYGDPAGLGDLREAIAAYLRPTRGVVVAPECIIVTAGAQGALALAAHLLRPGGGAAGLEALCYRGAAEAFAAAGFSLYALPLDEDGLCVDALDGPTRGPVPMTAVYVSPSHQFPTGATLSLERRQHLLAWAAAHDAFIVEDDSTGDFRFEGSPLPALAALDRAERVLYVGSFSRSIGPSLRLGYLVVPPAFAVRAQEIKRRTDMGQPWLEQAVLARFIGEGGFVNHLRRMRNTLLARRNRLVAALHETLGPVRLSGLQAGCHLVWTLPEEMAAERLVAAAARQGVGIQPLRSPLVAAIPAPGTPATAEAGRQVMLGLGGVDEIRIAQGVAGLNRAVAALRD